MNKKHKRTLEAIYKTPVQSNVVWDDVEKLLNPQKETDKGALVSIRRFLENAGVKPC